jgi:hypothetical protein
MAEQIVQGPDVLASDQDLASTIRDLVPGESYADTYISHTIRIELYVGPLLPKVRGHCSDAIQHGWHVAVSEILDLANTLGLQPCFTNWDGFAVFASVLTSCMTLEIPLENKPDAKQLARLSLDIISKALHQQDCSKMDTSFESSVTIPNDPTLCQTTS